VDRLSRGSANKVQRIAVRPRPSPPAQPPPHLSPSLTEKVSTEVRPPARPGHSPPGRLTLPRSPVLPQVALRHKSEIAHHRNKLRQRAKRRGQCEFPSIDDIMDAFGDGALQSEAAQRLYSSAHDHMDCILQANHPPPTPTDSRRRSDLRTRIFMIH